jgi:3-polyprenyl-4-hydroxybenzoate decarboxylase
MFHKLILISLILLFNSCLGGIIFPPMPAFYNKSNSIIAMVDEGVGRVLDTFGVNVEGLYTPWEGL